MSHWQSSSVRGLHGLEAKRKFDLNTLELDGDGESRGPKRSKESSDALQKQPEAEAPAIAHVEQVTSKILCAFAWPIA